MDGNGERDRLTDRQLRVIPFLLEAPSIEEGCKRAKVSKATLYAWLKEETFREELHKQRVKRLEEKALLGPCNHGEEILYDPTEEEVEKLEKELANCPNRHQHGPRPGFFIVRFTSYRKAGDKDS